MILNIFKIGGSIVDNEELLQGFASQLAEIEGRKIIVHGGGKSASDMCKQLGIDVKMHEGRRITDEDVLKVVVMIYGGWINKRVVATLQASGINAAGFSGADGNIIKAHKRSGTKIDYGFAGDIDSVNAELLEQFLEQGLTPAMAPLTHDGNGQLLNTNADTIAAAVAGAMSIAYDVRLVYILDFPGVMKDIQDISSIIPEINAGEIDALKEQGVISEGMIPKLHNARQALDLGASEVIIINVDQLSKIDKGGGTRIS